MAIRTWKRFGWANLWHVCQSFHSRCGGRQVQSLLSVPGSDGQRGDREREDARDVQ